MKRFLKYSLEYFQEASRNKLFGHFLGGCSGYLSGIQSLFSGIFREDSYSFHLENGLWDFYRRVQVDYTHS